MQSSSFRGLFRILGVVLGLSVFLVGASTNVGSQTYTDNAQAQQGKPTPEQQELNRLGAEGERAANKGDFKTAEKAWQAALEKAQAIGDERQAARYLSNLGFIYAEGLGQLEKAKDYFSRALALEEKLGDEEGIAVNLTSLGLVYKRLGQWEKARDYYVRALPFLEKLGNEENEEFVAGSFKNLGEIYGNLEQWEKAKDCYARVLAFHEKRRDERNVAFSLAHLGEIHEQMGQLEKAKEYHVRALDLFKKWSDERNAAATLNNLGAVYGRLGQSEKAKECHAHALDSFKKLNDERGIADSLNGLGVVHTYLGQLEKAVDSLTRALTLREKRDDKRGIAATLNNLGAVYERLGQWEKAADYLTRALDVYKGIRDERHIALSLTNLGEVYRRQGQLDTAEDCLNRARALHEKRGDEQYIAGTFTNLSAVCWSRGQLEKAENYLARALALQEKLGNERDIAGILNNMGAVYKQLRQLEKAENYLARALALQEKLGNEQHMAISLNNLGDVYGSLGQLEKARSAFDRAVRHYETIGAQVGDPTQLGAFQETTDNLYARYAALLVRLGRPSDALVMSERGRGQGLARQAAQNGTDFTPSFSPEDAAQWKTAHEELTVANRLLRAAQNRPEPTDPDDKGAFQRQHDDARQHVQDAERRVALLRDALFARYPAYKQVQGHQPPTAAQLTALARRNPDTLFLEWVIVDDKTTLLFALSHKDGLKTFTLSKGQDDLKAMVERWRTVLIGEDRTKEPRQAKALYQTLLDSVEKAGLLQPKRYARLAIVADGPLLNVPFAALMDGNGRRLIERYALSVSVSLGMLTWTTNPRKPTATLLCAVDPAGTKGEKFGSPLRSGYEPLGYAREEAKKLAGLFPGAVGLAGPEAREAEVKKQMSQFALLHFATHGFLSDNGLRSWLLLAEEPPDGAEDGRLEAREIVGLPLTAQLAVLSACQTGLGQKSGGEGLMGLAWAFRAAGCPSIVASQWKVYDKATARLMTAFYQNLTKGQRKDDALRSAMLSVRTWAQKAKTFDAPRWWAGFQVMGDTAPLSRPMLSQRGVR